MSTDFDMDLDDIFNDLEAHVETRSNENIFDKFDRLREDYEAAFSDHNLAIFEAKCEGLARRLSPEIASQTEYGPRDAIYRNTYSSKWRDVIISRPSPSFYTSASPEVQTAILETIRQMKPAIDTIASTKDAYDAVRREVDENLIEGCYVSFDNPNGQNIYGDVSSVITGHGVLVGITEKNYVIHLDRDNTDRRIKGDTARIKIDSAFEDAYCGGRNLELQWGPNGWAREGARQAERQRVAQLAQQARERAERKMQLALDEASQLEQAWTTYHNALGRVADFATKRAHEELMQTHRDEYLVLLRDHSLRINAEVEATRPEREIDSQPSRRWQDYMEEEN